MEERNHPDDSCENSAAEPPPPVADRDSDDWSHSEWFATWLKLADDH